MSSSWSASPDLPGAMSSSGWVHPHSDTSLLTSPGGCGICHPVEDPGSRSCSSLSPLSPQKAATYWEWTWHPLHFYQILGDSLPSRCHLEACSAVGWHSMTVTYGCVHCEAPSTLFKILLRKRISHARTLHTERGALPPIRLYVNPEVLVSNCKYYTPSVLVNFLNPCEDPYSDPQRGFSSKSRCCL